ncbi:hypothetical protein PIB30_106236 [Stylosanthes scabra]|uniref:Uncharacterized protein n=1 Tax=Stylosanthes scabra TaxID=79078 RepID=A0ABU6RYM9_9FABA|nr:hypothetical protein [Stylosanthes scabra]
MRGGSASSHTSSRLHNFKRDSDFAKLHSSTHMLGKTLWQQETSQDPCIGVKVHAYAWKAHSSLVPESRLAQPKRDQDFSKPKSATHRRRSPRICVGSQQLTFEAHVGRAKRDSILASPFQKPRICVEQQAYAWKASSMPKISKTYVYA